METDKEQIFSAPGRRSYMEITRYGKMNKSLALIRHTFDLSGSTERERIKQQNF